MPEVIAEPQNRNGNAHIAAPVGTAAYIGGTIAGSIGSGAAAGGTYLVHSTYKSVTGWVFGKDEDEEIEEGDLVIREHRDGRIAAHVKLNDLREDLREDKSIWKMTYEVAGAAHCGTSQAGPEGGAVAARKTVLDGEAPGWMKRISSWWNS